MLTRKLHSLHIVRESVFTIDRQGRECQKWAILTFHRFSVVVWLIWLVPYFTGFFISMVLPAPYDLLPIL